MDTITSIGYSAFINCSLTSVYYVGSVSDWINITIEKDNDNLNNATKYYYSKTKPNDTTNNYWHYDSKGNIVIW